MAEEKSTPVTEEATEEKVAEKKTTKKKAPKKDAKAKGKEANTNEAELEIEEIPESETEPIDDLDEEAEAMRMATELFSRIFAKKKVNGMTYAEKKEVYGKDIKSADKMRLSEDERAMQRADYAKEEYKELALAANPKKNILKVVEITGAVPDEKYGYVLEARLVSKDPFLDKKRGEFTIRIPLSEFADLSNDESFQGKNGLYHLDRALNRLLGLRVHVSIFEVNEKKAEAWASRLAASAKLSKYNFRGGNGKPGFKVGDVVTGTVIFTKRDSIVVSVYGQDCKIKTEDTTWTAAGPLYEEFRIGQKVNVKIMELDNDAVWSVNGHEYHLSKVKLSVKEATVNPNEAYFDKFEQGGKYLGEVKSITRDGTKVFVVLANKVLCLCDAPGLGVLGDRVVVLITKMDEKDKRIWGNIVSESL